MKRNMMLMGLWSRSGEKSQEELEEELLRRWDELPSPGELYAYQDVREGQRVDFVGAEVSCYEPLPMGMEVWAVTGTYTKEEETQGIRLKNLVSGEVFVRGDEEADHRQLRKQLWDHELSGPIFERRSVRRYEDRPVEEEKIERLLRAAMQAPSAKNQQPWEIVVVEDRGLMTALAEELEYGKMLAHSPLCFVMLGSTRKLSSPLRWPQDLSAATQNVLLQATQEGLGAVWVSLYPEESRMQLIVETLELPEFLVPFNIIALGYPAEFPPPIDRFNPQKVHWR